MSTPLVLIKGTAVYGPGIAENDEVSLTNQLITLPGQLTAELLFVKHCNQKDVQKYLLATLFNSDTKMPRTYPYSSQKHSNYCTLVSIPKHRHNICVDPKIVRSVYSVYRKGERPQADQGFFSSIHTFHLINHGDKKHKMQAVVFFRNEIFYKQDATGSVITRLGGSMCDAIDLCMMNSFKATPVDLDDRFYFLTVQKNTHSTCWCIQTMYCLYTLTGKQLMNLMYRVHQFTSDEINKFNEMIESLNESERMRVRQLHELFTYIYHWMNFCCKLDQVTYVCMDELRNFFVACSLLQCTLHPDAQEDLQEMVRRIFDLFLEYHRFLGRISGDDWRDFLKLTDVDPIFNCHSTVLISYECKECGHKAHKERHFFSGGFKVNPSEYPIQSDDGLFEAINSLYSTFCNIQCNNGACRKIIKKKDLETVEILPCTKNSKFLVCCQLNNDSRFLSRQSWHIPTNEFYIGRNVCKVKYIAMNHPSGNFGTSGHYTGALIIDKDVVFLDDGSHPIPITDLSNVSKYATCLVCVVTRLLNDDEYSSFHAKVEEIQKKEHIQEQFNHVMYTINGIMENLQPTTEAAVKAWEDNRQEALLEYAKSCFSELESRIREAEYYIAEYNRIIPEDKRELKIQAASISVESLSESAARLRSRLTS